MQRLSLVLTELMFGVALRLSLFQGVIAGGSWEHVRLSQLWHKPDILLWRSKYISISRHIEYFLL